MKCIDMPKEPLGDTSSSSRTLFIHQPGLSLNLVWTNISYKVTSNRWSLRHPFCESVSKTILSHCNGSAESASLTAIVGPSGAGKSTLLQILAGRKEIGVTGDVCVNHDLPAKRMIKVTFMGQNDDFSPNLTVKETLHFASKLMHHERVKYKKDHQEKSLSSVANILHDLKLTSCADVRVSQCSGGQIKRLSIACELIALPNIMLLDEPSSGLDSNCALQVIELLKKLAVEKDIAIIVSIHQPNSKIVSIFDQLYVLSHDGRNIYKGPSNGLGDYLNKNGVDCPLYFNPTDIMLDIASGSYNHEVFTAMTKAQRTVDIIPTDNNNSSYANTISMRKIFDRMMTRSLPLLSHTCIIFHRSLILSLREPLVFFLSFLQHVGVAIVAGSVYTSEIGGYDGCYHEKYINPLYFNSNTTESVQRENLQTFSGITVIVVNALFLFLATVSSTALTFPLEVKVFMKEKTNRWYSCLSYYIGRTLADAPFRIAFPIIYSILIWHLTGQENDAYRIFLFCLINVAFSFMAQANGIFFSCVFIDSISAAAVNGCVSLTPFILLGGFIVSVKSMPPWARYLSNFSYFRHAFEASTSIIYGMDRCSHFINHTDDSLHTPYSDLHNTLQSSNLTYNSMFKLFKRYLVAQDVQDAEASEIIQKLRVASNTTKEIFRNIERAGYPGRSFVLDTFGVPEYYMWTPMAVLLAYFLFFRLLAYIILLYRSTPKK